VGYEISNGNGRFNPGQKEKRRQNNEEGYILSGSGSVSGWFGLGLCTKTGTSAGTSASTSTGTSAGTSTSAKAGTDSA